MRLKLTLSIIALSLSPAALLAQQSGQQAPQSLEKTITKVIKVKYLLYLPKQYSMDQSKKWPMILFLHGSGESGDDLEKVKVHGPPKLVEQGKEIPFIIVSPQSPGGGWNIEALDALLNEVTSKYAVDQDRLIVTGLSMGGFGTWSLALEFPNRFAAIAPICGGGIPARARRLRNTPAWVFHGAKDPVVPLKASQDMVDALKAAGGDVKFTVYPEAGHDAWTEAYNSPELWEWFLQQKRKPVPPAQ